MGYLHSDYLSDFLPKLAHRLPSQSLGLGLNLRFGEESIKLFKENYRNADEYCCLFVIETQFAGFVFVPFSED